MKPRGPARQALRRALEQVGAPLTWRSMAVFTQVGFRTARATADNMHRAGELAVVGAVREPGACRPMRLYAPVPAGGAAPDAGAGLQGRAGQGVGQGAGLELVNSWRAGR